MIQEHVSCGVIPYRRRSQGWEVLLVQHHAGFWSFPKGHQEPGESGPQTAERELREETGIQFVQLDTAHSFLEEYSYADELGKHHKRVTYYLGRVSQHTLRVQTEELKTARWFPLALVAATLTFADTRKLFEEATRYLPNVT